MSGIGPARPGGDELERDPALSGAVDELHRYADLVDASPSPGFTDRVMTAVDAAPAPRAGLLGWFATRFAALGAPARQSLRLVALTAVVVLAVGGALAGAELSGLLRNGPSAGSSSEPTPSPVVTATPSPSASPTLESTESPSFEPTESPSPTNGSGGAEPTSSARETETPSTQSLEPTASGGQSETLQPSETPESSPSPSGGGDG